MSKTLSNKRQSNVFQPTSKLFYLNRFSTMNHLFLMKTNSQKKKLKILKLRTYAVKKCFLCERFKSVNITKIVYLLTFCM